MIDIFEEDGEFYYYDETDDIVGPFKTIEHAEEAYQASLRWHTRDHKDSIKKMRHYYD